MQVKNKSDLEEFPDGGRATLVRRYSPSLTWRELDVLQKCPYDSPALIKSDSPSRRTALALVRHQLLERDPTSPDIFRVTEAGEEVVAHWRAAGLLT